MPEVEKQIVVEADIPFCHRGGIELKANLFRPASGHSLPLLITLPGGAWRQCNRRNHWGWGEYLAQCGYAVLTPEYRIATFERKAFPDAVQDVLAAIRFARAKADAWRVAPDRIGILGSSAGAHLAALAALGGDTQLFASSDQADSHISTLVKVLVAIYGIYDLVAHWQDDLRTNPDPKGNVARNLLARIHSRNSSGTSMPRRSATSPMPRIDFPCCSRGEPMTTRSIQGNPNFS